MPYNAQDNRVPILNYPIKLDLGSGPFPKDGFITLDYAYDANIKWDVTKGIPLPDDSVYELYTSHCLEHFNLQEFDEVLREIVRVCQDEANITIIVPHSDTPEGRLPGHYMQFDEKTMQAINQWLPHDQLPHLEVKDIKRDGYSIIGIYKVKK